MLDDKPASRPRRRAFFWLLYPVYLFVLVELCCHVYWGVVKQTSTVRPDVWGTYFLEWNRSGAADATEASRDGTYRVLLFGGSVVSEEYGTIGQQLADGLTDRMGRNVRVYNLAYMARTSRDSLIKYRALADRHFDLVVFYHGINDTKMNCCPPDLFRDDYRHCRWYDEIATYQELGSSRWIVAPFTASLAYHAAARRLNWEESMGRRPNADDPWAGYGSEIRTAGPFRSNLTEVIALARQRRERVLVMTFAYHLPHLATGKDEDPNDFADHKSSVRIWGYGQNVAQGVDVHNGIVMDLVKNNSDLLFVDQHALMPRDANHFLDCCHFTPSGCTAWVKNVLDHAGDQLHAIPCDCATAGR